MSADKRFMIRGRGRVLWLPIVPPNPLAITIADAGNGSTDITCDIRSIGGLDVNFTPLDVSTQASPHGRSIPGKSPSEAISLELYSYTDGTDVARPLLRPGVGGWLLVAPLGVAVGNRTLLFQVESAGNADVWTVDPRGATYLVPLTKRRTYPNGVLV